MDMMMNMPTTTAMSMETSSTTSGMSMSMQDMNITFFEAFQTPLYATAWTPTSPAQYSGACVFLIVLACTLRLLLAVKPIFEERFWKNYPVYDSDDKGQLHEVSQQQHHQSDGNGPGMGAAVVRRDMVSRWRGWRAGASAARATYEVIVGGVGYLLMLAIMTMNLGYFLSVLAGIWLGTFLLGGLASSTAMIHG